MGGQRCVTLETVLSVTIMVGARLLETSVCVMTSTTTGALISAQRITGVVSWAQDRFVFRELWTTTVTTMALVRRMVCHVSVLN